MAEILDEQGKIVGQTRGAKAYKKWVPKEWRPEYEAITALSCTGLNNEEVGRRFGYGKQQVSNIINTPQAKKLREIITERLRNVNLETIGDRLDNISELAVKRLEEVIENDAVASKYPLAMFDRSLQLLKTTGVLKGDSPIGNVTNTINNVKNTALVLSSEAAQLLNEGLRKANEVKILHSDSKLIKS